MSLLCSYIFESDEYTGTYRFIKCFYVFTDITAAFQKVMKYTPIGLKNTYSFMHGIIIDDIGSLLEHLTLEYKCLKKRDEINLLSNLP